jgi:Tol biopolymer transport system component
MIRQVLRPGQWLAVFCGLGACGRIGVVELFPTGPFDAPQPIFAPADLPPDTTDADDGDDDPTLTDDMREIYFASNRTTGKNGPHDIWRSTRPNITAPWGSPMVVTELNDPDQEIDDRSPGISGDGFTIWFSSTHGHTDENIYVATRRSREDPWEQPHRVDVLSTAGIDDYGPEPARSGQRITFFQEGTPRRLFEASRTSGTAEWNAPSQIASVNNMPGTKNHMSGFFVSDVELWFAADSDSDATGADSGGYDIYRALRPSIGEPFNDVAPVKGVNGKRRDNDPWLSPDGKILFFTKQDDIRRAIYSATRTE